MCGYRIPALLLIALALGACGASQQHYKLRGRVLSRDAGQLTVTHEDIPGFMPAMTMQYPVKDAAGLKPVRVGDSIAADLVVDKDKKFWLEHLVVTASDGRDVAVTDSEELEEGAQIPDVELINQDGKKIHLADLKGKAVLITFIYTRCPFPNFCPLLSNEFAAIQRELLKTPADYRRTHLMSVSLDPAWDKPPVLRKYGLSYLHDDPAGFEHWEFVATTPQDLSKLAAAFGLTYYEENNQITHSLRTILLARDGTVAKVWPGNEWRKQELIDDIRQAAAVPYEGKQ